MFVCVLVEEGRAGSMRDRAGGRERSGRGMRLWPLLLGLMWKLSTDLCDFTPVLWRGPALPLTAVGYLSVFKWGSPPK